MHALGHPRIRPRLDFDQHVNVVLRRTPKPPDQVIVALPASATDIAGVHALERCQRRVVRPGLIDRCAQQFLRHFGECKYLLASGIAEEDHA